MNTAHSISANLRVMLVDDQPERAKMVEDAMIAAGHKVLSTIPSATGLLFQIEQHQPDVILVDLDSPDRDMLDSLSVINAHNPMPVVMFSKEDDPEFIQQAVRSGVTAYQLDSISADKVKPVLDVAMAQFSAFQSVKQALDDTRSELADRKIIEKAKGLLMKVHSVSEDEAFKTLRGLAMETNQKLGVTAQSVITMLEKAVK